MHSNKNYSVFQKCRLCDPQLEGPTGNPVIAIGLVHAPSSYEQGRNKKKKFGG